MTPPPHPITGQTGQNGGRARPVHGPHEPPCASMHLYLSVLGRPESPTFSPIFVYKSSQEFANNPTKSTGQSAQNTSLSVSCTWRRTLINLSNHARKRCQQRGITTERL